MKNLLVVFSHGMESSPQSTKIQIMSKIAVEKGCKTMAPDYRASIDPIVHLEMLKDELANVDFDELILVGSSMGAYVSLSMAALREKIKGLFLMAPAIGIYKTGDPTPNAEKTTIIHGWQDELIDLDAVINYARKYSANLQLVDDNHRLQSSYAYLEQSFANFLDSLK